MGNVLSPAKKINSLVLGLDNSGKTTTLYGLRLEQVTKQFKPTTGFNFEVVSKVFRGAKYEFHMWDLAGKPELRHLWKHYYAEMSVGVVIFVVDGNDASRLPAAKKELAMMIHEDGLRNTMFVVLINVKDPGSEFVLKEPEVRRKLGILDFDPITHPVKIIEANAFQTASLAPVLTYVCQQYR